MQHAPGTCLPTIGVRLSPTQAPSTDTRKKHGPKRRGRGKDMDVWRDGSKNRVLLLTRQIQIHGNLGNYEASKLQIQPSLQFLFTSPEMLAATDPPLDCTKDGLVSQQSHASSQSKR